MDRIIGNYLAGAPEIEISPEMRQAGASVIAELHGVVSSEFLAQEVYIAMVRIAADFAIGGKIRG